MKKSNSFFGKLQMACYISGKVSNNIQERHEFFD